MKEEILKERNVIEVSEDEIINQDRCIAACPDCLRTCTLNQGHMCPHRCPEGHEWR